MTSVRLRRLQEFGEGLDSAGAVDAWLHRSDEGAGTSDPMSERGVLGAR